MEDERRGSGEPAGAGSQVAGSRNVKEQKGRERKKRKEKEIKGRERGKKGLKKQEGSIS